MDLLFMFNVNYVLITALAVLSTSYAVSFLGGRRRKYPPGPSVWPLLGSLPYMIRSRLSPLKFLVKLAKDYGDIAYLRIIGFDIVVLSDYNIIKEAFHRADFSARPEAVYSSVAGRPNFGLVTASGDVSREQRQIAHAFFRTFGIGKSSFEEKIVEEVSYLINEFKLTDSKPIDPKLTLNNAVSNIICSVVFGSRHEYTDPVFNALQNGVFSNLKISKLGGCFFFLHRLAGIPYSPGYYIRKNVTCIISQMRKIVEDHLKDHHPNHPRDMIDMYIDKIHEVQKSGVGTSYDETNMLFTLADTFSAGSETSTTILRWLLLHMVDEPDVQSRVQAEIDRAVGRDRMPTLADRPSMQFTEATILETLRKDFVVPVGAPHQFSRPGGGSFHGYHIPDGALVIANNWKISHDPEMWAEPLEFRPERFINSDGICEKPEEIIPFSIGKRVCIGESLAKMEIFLAFSHLLHRFTFTRPQEVTSYSLEGEFGAVYTPKPFTLCAIPRE